MSSPTPADLTLLSLYFLMTIGLGIAVFLWRKKNPSPTKSNAPSSTGITNTEHSHSAPSEAGYDSPEVSDIYGTQNLSQIAEETSSSFLNRVRTDGLTAIDALGLIILIMMYFAFLALPMMVSDPNAVPLQDRDITAGAIVLSMLLTSMFCCIPLALIGMRGSISDFLGLKWKSWPLIFAIAPVSLIFMLLFGAALQFTGYESLMKTLFPSSGLQEAVQLIKNTDDMAVLITMAISAVIIAPIVEEIIFRGYIYPVMKKHSGRLAAIILSSLMFSLVHGNILGTLPLFIFAILLALAYEATGSIWAPMGMHALFNGTTVAALIAMRTIDPSALPVSP